MEGREAVEKLLPALQLKKEGRIEEAFILLKTIIDESSSIEIRYMAAREISMTLSHVASKDQFFAKQLSDRDTAAGKDFWKYTKFAVDAYDKIPQSMQQEYKIDGAREALNEIESNASEAAGFDAAKNIVQQLQLLANESHGLRQIIFGVGMKHVENVKNQLRLIPKLVKTFAQSDDSVIEETRNLVKIANVLVIYNKETAQYQLYELTQQSSGGCFIATATFGTALAPEVLYLQQYRNCVLSMSKRGRAFVNVYYAISPPIARVISKSIVLKTLTRALFLNPLIKILRYLYPAQSLTK